MRSHFPWSAVLVWRWRAEGGAHLPIGREACLHRLCVGFDHGALQFASPIRADLRSLLHRLTNMFAEDKGVLSWLQRYASF